MTSRTITSVRGFGFGLVFFMTGCGASLAGGHDAGSDQAMACAASGASCAASGCCASVIDVCLAQGSDKLCLNAIPPPTGGPSCDGPAASDLPGVSLAFPDAPCAYTLATVAVGIEIAYQEVIAAGVSGVHPTQKDDGRCGQPDDAGLIVSYSISGAGQNYCLCDTGLCAPPPIFNTAPVAGTHDRQIPWDGRNWSGPSDTNNAEGAAFPPGTYTLTLTAVGTHGASPDAAVADSGTDSPFTVTATRYLTITP
jgi:hypothetical protein